MEKRATSLLVSLLGLIAGFVAPNAAAQTYPSKPVTVIYPFPPGGASEIPQRAQMTEAAKLLGQPIVFENRPGAHSRLGVTAMRNAPPDGYVISTAIDGLLTTQPLIDPEFKFQPLRDYMPVALQFESTQALMGPPTLPFNDMKGLVSFAKANPGKLNMAITVGSTTHIMAERIREVAGIDITLIGYKGSSQAYTDLMAGRVDLVLGTGKVYVDSGKLIAIATTGRNRWASLPRVPTMTETGVPFVASLWFAIIAHPNTPADVVAKLNGVFAASMKTPGFLKALEGTDVTAMQTLPPEGIAAFIRSEMTTLEPIVRKARIKME